MYKIRSYFFTSYFYDNFRLEGSILNVIAIILIYIYILSKVRHNED